MECDDVLLDESCPVSGVVPLYRQDLKVQEE